MQHDIERALITNDAYLLKKLVEAPAKNGAPNGKYETAPLNAAARATTTLSLNTRRLSDIEAKPVRWLWPGRIARGKLTMIAGNPGLGKSQITASIAAIVTTGGRWPVDGQPCEPGNLLFFSAEDDPGDTLRPRLEAAGADLKRIHFADSVAAAYTGDGDLKNRAFSVDRDLPALGLKLEELGDVAAVVIDPITAYLGSTDSHKNAEVRGLLAPLSELAARHDIAIIAVSHLTKAGVGQALMRVIGSLAFVAAARAAYLVTTDPQDKTRRFFLPMKNNLARDTDGLAFRIEDATVGSPAGPLATSRVDWESEPVSITADELMEAEKPASVSAVEVAKGWLMKTLADAPVLATELYDRAVSTGISSPSLRRAQKELGIKPFKNAMKGPWWWSLPAKMLKRPEDAQGNDLSTFDGFEHLRSASEVEIDL